MMKKQTISLCMIVRNEEDHIEQALQSVKGLVDEIIIVDTGSTDQTRVICEKFNATVVRVPWTGDFAEARNESIQHATKDWILYLDADETLDKRSHKTIRQRIKKTTATVLTCTLLNYYGDSLPVQHNQLYTIQQPRLFRNRQDIYFKNRIHETIDRTEPFLTDEIDHSDILIHHIGYIDEIANKKEKKNRNLSLLIEEVKDPNHSPWTEYHLASEYNRLQHYEAALLLINASIVRFIEHRVLPPSLLYALKYLILIHIEHYDQALLGIEKAIQLYSDYVDLHYYKGIIQYHLGQYKEAIATFDHCMTLGDGHPQHLSLKGAGSFKANEWKEACMQK